MDKKDVTDQETAKGLTKTERVAYATFGLVLFAMGLNSLGVDTTTVGEDLILAIKLFVTLAGFLLLAKSIKGGD